MSEWISIQKTRPPVGQVLAWLRDGTYQVYHVYHGDHVFPEIVAWHPLPPPPPRESSFERWADIQVKNIYDYILCTDLHDPFYVRRDAAKRIWDAAVKADQSPDFVP